MIWLRASAALLTTALFGAAILTLVAGDVRRFSPAERLGLSFGLGLIGLPWGLFLLSLAGVAPAWWLGAGLTALALAGALALRRDALPGWRASGESAPWTTAVVLPAALLGGFLLVHTAVSLLEPVAEWDTIAIWALKAKVVLHEPVAASSYFRDPAKAYSHLDYPLLWPFAMAWVWTCTGSADLTSVKILGPALLAALAATFHGLAARRGPRAAAMAYTALLCGIPIVLSQTSRLLADAPLAFFALLAFGASSTWLESRDDAWIRLSGVFAAGMILTKNEGLGLAAILVMALLLCRAPVRPVATWTIALPAVLTAPWLIFRAGIPKLAEDYGARLQPALFLANIGRVPAIARALATEALNLEDWLLLWPLVLLGLILGARRLRRPPSALVAVSLGLIAAMYGAVYVVTPWDVGPLIESTAARLMLHAAPLGTFCFFLQTQGREDARP